MKLEAWLAQVPESLKNDPIWQTEVYPKALLLFDLLWEDCRTLLKDVRGRAIAAQLTRSAGSISANLDEGYGRGVDRGEFVQFLRYALGSARETRGWLYKARKLLREDVVKHRLSLSTELIALLTANIDRRRRQQP
jgi:four helix bundle protein